jgi:hypothetical protein
VPSTYIPIATNTVAGASTTTITFSSIPSTYTDLVIIAQYKAVSNNYLMVRLNGDTGNNYSRTEIQSTGSSVFNYNGSNEPYAYISSVYAQAGEFGTFILNFNNYSNSTTNKNILSRGNNAASSAGGTSAVINTWRSTAVVNTILLTPIGTGFDIGSTFSLYGIKAA